MRASNMRLFLHWAAACACLLALQGAAASSQLPDTGDHSAAVQTFNENVERYARLRARFEEPLPSFDERRDPWSLLLTRRYLASAIRTARSGAVLGDVFTPPASRAFRALVREAIDDVENEGLADRDLQIDDFVIDLQVDEPVPRWSLRAVPDVLLRRLPALPPGVEYRLVGQALILWDAHAEIVIDALPGVLAGE